MFFKTGDVVNLIVFIFLKYSWAEFIYTRCQNVNRKSKYAVQSDDVPSSPSKKSKIDPEKHAYPPLSLDAEDKTSLDRNITLLQQELAKARPHFESVASLMERTFISRRQWILDNAESVGTIIEKYPFLAKSLYVRHFLAILDATFTSTLSVHRCRMSLV